ncbi:MAG: cupin domain-containing protein [Kiritimatiellia bacterium]|nr:cupin domain-containing protein [Kiritimatiellia bacterium]
MIAKSNQLESSISPSMRGGEGAVLVEKWFKPEAFGAKVRMCNRLTLQPGSSIGLHRHEGEDEIYLILSGAGTVLDEKGVAQSVSEGDAILTGKGESHALRNDGHEPLTLAAIIILYA